ncbi:hypothetical protein [Bosea sp. 2RAB26]|uniref:hypothetical protein n=1 Tax=Bosea sp. 2RAB26 TaxID=3237476 RepID=UPI003F939112
MPAIAVANRTTRVLLGSPIAHSVSLAMHAVAARAARFEARCHLIEIIGAEPSDNAKAEAFDRVMAARATIDRAA